MSTMCYQFNKFIEASLENSRFSARKRCYTFSVHYKYDDFTNEAMFYAIRNTEDENLYRLNWDDVDVDFYITDINGDFKTCFNITDHVIEEYADYVNASELGIVEQRYDYKTPLYKFSNVWNRRYCFVHASFVSGTSFQYLGRSGDFYIKPSKMYKFTGNTTDFTLAISFNGYTPIRTNEISFIVELAYIYAEENNFIFIKMPLYTLSSTNPEHYSRIRVSLPMEMSAKFINICVNSLTANANFRVLNDDDYIEFNINNIQYKLKLKSYSKLTSASLPFIFQELLNEQSIPIQVQMSDIDTIIFSSSEPFKIVSMSYNARLITGFYSTKTDDFPISSVPYEATEEIKQISENIDIIQATVSNARVRKGYTSELQLNFSI